LGLSEFVHRMGIDMASCSSEFCYSVLFSACLSERRRFLSCWPRPDLWEIFVPQEDIMNLVFLRWRSGLFVLFGADSTQKIVVSSLFLMSIHICSVMMT
jgi:hypothetical protein